MTVDQLIAAVLDLNSHSHVTNFYRDNGCCPLPSDTHDGPAERLDRLRDHLANRRDAPVVLIGEAAGWRGARQTGVPFTSPAQLGQQTREASATTVEAALKELDLVNDVLLWNACLLHPHRATKAGSNAPPPTAAVDECLELLEEVMRDRLVVAVGRRSEYAVGRIIGAGIERAGAAPADAIAVSVRHPSYGGAPEFRDGLRHVAKHLSI